MTTKQKFKILSLLFTILSVVSLFIPVMKDSKKNYSAFDLVNYNGFKFLILLIIILAIVALATNLMAISYDKNKIFPIITLAASFICAILMIFVKQLSSPSGAFSKEIWMEDTTIHAGTYMLIISSFISFITNTIITIRTFVLGKNDDDYVVGPIEEESDEPTWGDQETDENEENIDEEIDILEEFKENK